MSNIAITVVFESSRAFCTSDQMATEGDGGSTRMASALSSVERARCAGVPHSYVPVTVMSSFSTMASRIYRTHISVAQNNALGGRSRRIFIQITHSGTCCERNSCCFIMKICVHPKYFITSAYTSECLLKIGTIAVTCSAAQHSSCAAGNTNPSFS